MRRWRLEHDGNCGGGKRWLGSGFILEMGPTCSLMISMWKMGEREGLRATQRFWLSNWKDGVAITEIRKSVGGTSMGEDKELF